MMITRQSLDEKLQALVQQREQGLALYQQACGAIQLVEALQAELQDALSEKQLAKMLESATNEQHNE